MDVGAQWTQVLGRDEIGYMVKQFDERGEDVNLIRQSGVPYPRAKSIMKMVQDLHGTGNPDQRLLDARYREQLLRLAEVFVHVNDRDPAKWLRVFSALDTKRARAMSARLMWNDERRKQYTDQLLHRAKADVQVSGNFKWTDYPSSWRVTVGSNQFGHTVVVRANDPRENVLHVTVSGNGFTPERPNSRGEYPLPKGIASIGVRYANGLPRRLPLASDYILKHGQEEDYFLHATIPSADVTGPTVLSVVETSGATHSLVFNPTIPLVSGLLMVV